ncbi:hypothetical protein KI387_003819 [Taxus chinensis]|uniref:SHSP domain-containing protein n=1 Tax=Taxus chinensis TaxID=29808 RepID=A0AA38GYZ5_TAXCH|nr:hypothetical protein KI387_003819 [Taxus chinensis]
MESNMGVRARNCSDGDDPVSVGGVQIRETRSSYFLNLNLQGLSKDDIQLEMDSQRCLIIRGQKYYQDMGIHRWTWRLVDNGSPTMSSRKRKPFRIPEDVNVGAIRASFHEAGALHVVLPKLRHTRFSPYHIHIHSSSNSNRGRPQLHSSKPQQPQIAEGEKKEQQNGDMDMEMEMVLPGHPEDDMSTVITIEEKCREIPASAWLQRSCEEGDDLMKKQEETVSQSENPHKVAGGEGMKATYHTTTQAKQRSATVPPDEEKERERKFEKRKVGRALIKHPKPFICKGLSHIFSSIATMARQKLGCG